MCAECFNLKDHEGHNYIRSDSYSGCCDCGDIESWKKEHWCAKHSNSEVVNNPELLLDAQQRSIIKQVFDAVSVITFISVLDSETPCSLSVVFSCLFVVDEASQLFPV